jgi:hypothetical protein
MITINEINDDSSHIDTLLVLKSKSSFVPKNKIKKEMIFLYKNLNYFSGCILKQ